MYCVFAWRFDAHHDERGWTRLNDWEMSDNVQREVKAIWSWIETQNSRELSDFQSCIKIFDNHLVVILRVWIFRAFWRLSSGEFAHVLFERTFAPEPLRLWPVFISHRRSWLTAEICRQSEWRAEIDRNRFK
jgi:hypothetical protein